jgi:Fe-S-cluster containining protein
MGKCSQCGECCRWFPIGLEKNATKEQKIYLEQRADAKDQGFYLLDSPCQNLVGGNCSIYAERPRLCRVFKGKPVWGNQRFYVPPGCTMAVEK